jgi:hypothetical protein
MGNFSRDPDERAAAGLARHYAGVRMQQGVPFLDADFNEADDLRRLEVEDLARWMLGDGVPSGSDGFRIAALAGGGVGTLVLTPDLPVGGGATSIAVDLEASTLAAALGFEEGNGDAARTGDAPARLTSGRAEPFALQNGGTLVVRANGGQPVSVAFATAQFADIALATAAEVAAVLNGAAGGFAAAAGTGNDFLVRGGGGSAARAGRILVAGRMLLNDRDVTYTGQPLFANAQLAAAWGVPPVPALATPVEAGRWTVYLDAWEREVGPAEDPALLDERVGMETARRLRREWAVRVAPAGDFAALEETRDPGHDFHVLARLERGANQAPVTEDVVRDARDTGISVRRAVSFYRRDGVLLVDDARLRTLLLDTRRLVRELVLFLTTKFVSPHTTYRAGEVAALQALDGLGRVAEQGALLIDARSLDTRGALRLFEQLMDAAEHFVAVWRVAVIPLHHANIPVYENSFGEMLDRIERLVSGPAPASIVPLSVALGRENLHEALRTQERINLELTAEIDRPTGFLLLTYLGSPAAMIQRNVPFDLRFEVSGSVSPDDDIGVEALLSPDWTATPKNANSTVPLNLRLGPGEGSAEFVLTVRPPNVPVSQTQLSVRVFAQHNPGGLSRIVPGTQLQIGSPPPGSEEELVIDVQTSSVSAVGGEFRVPTNVSSADFSFRLRNETENAVTAALTLTPASAPGWAIVAPPVNLTSQTVNANAHRDFLVQFGPPAAAGQVLDFTLAFVQTGTTLASRTIRLVTVAP